MSTISHLDDVTKIKSLDSQNMLGSIESLGDQVKQIASQIAKVKMPGNYKQARSVVIAGMGGSTLGSYIIKTLFSKELTIPVEIVNNYTLPRYVNQQTLVIISSYSGTTEEAVSALKYALKRKAKIAIITSGGILAEVARKKSIPALIFTTENNPCGSPRMGLGYSIFGQILLLAKAGLLSFSKSKVDQAIKTLHKYQKQFDLTNGQEHNQAKLIASNVRGRSVWYVGAEHLGGSVHAAANQMNENAKRFAGFFLIPELNHHLMEGMLYPKSNESELAFVLIESKLYDAKIQKRFEVTKAVLAKNKIHFVSYQCQETSIIQQVCEVLVLSSYVSFYSAVEEGIDPTAIPFVDYFKEALKK